MNPIEIYGISNKNLFEIAKLLFPDKKFTRIEHHKRLTYRLFYYNKIVHEFELKTGDELLKEIIDSGYCGTAIIDKSKFNMFKLFEIDGKHAWWKENFEVGTIYECLIKAVVWIREQKK